MKQIRQLENGDWVVDLGRRWFRVQLDGTVTAKRTYRKRGDAFYSVKNYKPSIAEITKARSEVTIFCGKNF